MMTRARSFFATEIPRPLLIAGALIPIVAALAGAARWVKSDADATYVRRDTFAIIQAGIAASATLQHQRDSLIYDAQFVRIDTSLAVLVRACQRRRECQ